MDKGATWCEFGRSQGIQTVHTPKLVCSTLVKDQLQVYELPADVFVYSGIFISTKKDQKEINKLKTILEAPEFTRYIRITGKDFSGGYKSITTKQIKNFAYGETKKHDLFS
jgi:adenine-specific DNA-methyltransferase